jgi:azurin
MNTKLLILSALTAFALTGCGQKGPSTSTEGTGSTASASTSGSSTAASGTKTVEITANDQMKFSVTSIEAKPGEELHVVLTNTGTLPKEAMGHNWVLLKQGSDPMAFSSAAASAKDQGYIPDNLKDQIVAHIDLLGPKQTGEVTFKAPDQPGDYPFLCSFPGHVAMMKGTLTVK